LFLQGLLCRNFPSGRQAAIDTTDATGTLARQVVVQATTLAVIRAGIRAIARLYPGGISTPDADITGDEQIFWQIRNQSRKS
jgi:hypothetical protein